MNRFLDRFIAYLTRRRHARHVRWLRKQRVLMPPQADDRSSLQAFRNTLPNKPF